MRWRIKKNKCYVCTKKSQKNQKSKGVEINQTNHNEFQPLGILQKRPKFPLRSFLLYEDHVDWYRQLFFGAQTHPCHGLIINNTKDLPDYFFLPKAGQDFSLSHKPGEKFSCIGFRPGRYLVAPRFCRDLLPIWLARKRWRIAAYWLGIARPFAVLRRGIRGCWTTPC